MTAAIGTGLVVQVLAMTLVLKRVGRDWPSYVGVLFLATAIGYHGLSEVAQALFPGVNIYREMIPLDDLDTWVIWVSVAILVFSLAYRNSLGRVTPIPHNRAEDLLGALPTTPLLTGVAGFAFLNVIASQQGLGSYFVSGIASQFLLAAIVLAASALALRNPRFRVMPLLVAGLAIWLVGSRLTLLAATIMMFGCLTLSGRRPSRAVVWLMLGTGAVAAIAVSGARESVGRDEIREAGVMERLYTISNGITSANRDVILGDLIYRFDGNAWGALLTGRYAAGSPGAGVEPLINSAWLAIPEFINQGKVETDITKRNEETYEVEAFNLPRSVDYLPMTLGIAYGYRGVSSLFVASVLFGVILGRLDRWLHTRNSKMTLPMYIGFAQPAIFMEQGIVIYPLTLRGMIVLVVVFALVLSASSLLPTSKKISTICLRSNSRTTISLKNEG